MELLTYKDVAAEMKVGTETIERLARSGRLPAIKVSAKMVRFTREDVETFISSHRQAASS